MLRVGHRLVTDLRTSDPVTLIRSPRWRRLDPLQSGAVEHKSLGVEPAVQRPKAGCPGG